MLAWAKRCALLFGGLATLLVGCVTRQHSNSNPMPNWEAEEVQTRTPQPASVAEAKPFSSSIATNVKPIPVTIAPSAPVVAAPESRATWVSLRVWCEEHHFPPPRLIENGEQ